MGYFIWLIKQGWKQYALHFTFGIVLTTLLLLNLDDIEGSPIIIKGLIFFSLFGYDIGVVYHSYLAYKKSK